MAANNTPPVVAGYHVSLGRYPNTLYSRKSTVIAANHFFGHRLRCCMAIAAWILVISGQCLAQTASTRCRYVNVATLPITLAAPQPIVDGSINGISTKMLVDTGASNTSLTREQVERMALAVRHSNIRALGVGGESVQYTTRVDEMSIDSVHGSRLNLKVIWDLKGSVPFGAVVGADFLFQSDIENRNATRDRLLARPSGTVRN